VTRYGMIVDLNRCVGCQACSIACKHANATPPGVQWRRVIDVELGRFPDVERVFVVTGCQHCAEPPCVPVCPTGATRQRADGLVTMDYDLCIGCAACAVACPYQARTIVHEQSGYYGAETPQERHVAHPERFGVANKCTFCIERIDKADPLGLMPGTDAEATPACALSCNAQAIRFGDFSDPASEVSRIARENRTFQMHAELGTDPQIRYVYEVAASTPGRAPDAADTDDEALANPANPLVGGRQRFWDYRAAMNFLFGGASAGLAIAASLAHSGGLFDAGALSLLYVAAAIMMAVGLFFVFLKLGRKVRFLYVLRRPQSSWMTRETWCVAVFYPAVGAHLLWPHPGLAAAVGAAAAGFLICQAGIIHASKGVPAWRAPLIPWMFVVAGLSDGIGLLALVAAVAWWKVFPALALSGAPLALANAALWVRYRATAKREGIGPLSRDDLAAISPLLHGLGHAAPAALYALSLAGGALAPALAALAGAAAAAGGALWKFWLIRRACHEQGFALPMLPQRGSGRRAAPERLFVKRLPAATCETDTIANA
jgi:phenylacetyl-CoA:acceptor oxidoreductase subunit 1